MKSSLFYLRSLFALLAMGATSIAAAAGLYTAGSTLPFSPNVLSNGGIVVGTSTGSVTTANGSTASSSSYVMTGPNAVGSISLGNTLTDPNSGYQAGLNDFSYVTLSPNGFTDPFPQGWTSFTNFTPVTLNIAPSSAAINLHSGGTVVPAVAFVGVNDNGNVAANLSVPGLEDAPINNEGAVLNLNNNTVTYVNGFVSGLNSSGQIAYTNAQQNFYNQSTGAWSSSPGTLNILNNGSPTQIATLGLGGETAGINSIAQVTGSIVTSNNGSSVAFRTGTNGQTTQLFGTANGISSTGTVINSSGQVGGYVTLASGQTEAFLSTARGGLMIGLGAGSATDNTQVTFLNDSGQAIVWDSTNGMDYLYSAGLLTPLSSLISGFTANQDQVVGFNNSGQILLSDPSLYTPTSASALSSSTLSGLSGTVSISSTAAYQQMAAAQGGITPSSSFYSSPSTSTDTVAMQTISSASSVPGPASLGLLALSALGLITLRRKKALSLMTV